MHPFYSHFLRKKGLLCQGEPCEEAIEGIVFLIFSKFSYSFIPEFWETGAKKVMRITLWHTLRGECAPYIFPCLSWELGCGYCNGAVTSHTNCVWSVSNHQCRKMIGPNDSAATMLIPEYIYSTHNKELTSTMLLFYSLLCRRAFYSNKSR